MPATALRLFGVRPKASHAVSALTESSPQKLRRARTTGRTCLSDYADEPQTIEETDGGTVVLGRTHALLLTNEGNIVVKELKESIDEAWESGTRVRLDYAKAGHKGDSLGKFFDGKTGTIQGFEKDGATKMYRVRLDDPVVIPGQGKVRDDLWNATFLVRLKEGVDEREGAWGQSQADGSLSMQGSAGSVYHITPESWRLRCDPQGSKGYDLGAFPTLAAAKKSAEWHSNKRKSTKGTGADESVLNEDSGDIEIFLNLDDFVRRKDVKTTAWEEMWRALKSYSPALDAARQAAIIAFKKALKQDRKFLARIDKLGFNLKESQDENMKTHLLEDDYADIMIGDDGLILLVNGEIVATENCDLNDEADCQRAEAELGKQAAALGYTDAVDEGPRSGLTHGADAGARQRQALRFRASRMRSGRNKGKGTNLNPGQYKGKGHHWRALGGESIEAVFATYCDEGLQLIDQDGAQLALVACDVADEAACEAAITAMDARAQAFGFEFVEEGAFDAGPNGGKVVNGDDFDDWASGEGYYARRYRRRTSNAETGKPTQPALESEGANEGKVPPQFLKNKGKGKPKDDDEDEEDPDDDEGDEEDDDDAEESLIGKVSDFLAEHLDPAKDLEAMREYDRLVMDGNYEAALDHAELLALGVDALDEYKRRTGASLSRFRRSLKTQTSSEKARNRIRRRTYRTSPAMKRKAKRYKIRVKRFMRPRESVEDDGEQLDFGHNSGQPSVTLEQVCAEAFGDLGGKHTSFTGLKERVARVVGGAVSDPKLMRVVSEFVNVGLIRYSPGKGYALVTEDEETYGRLAKAARASGQKFVVTLAGGQPIFLPTVEAQVEFWKSLPQKMRGAKMALGKFMTDVGVTAEDDAEEE